MQHKNKRLHVARALIEDPFGPLPQAHAFAGTRVAWTEDMHLLPTVADPEWSRPA